MDDEKKNKRNKNAKKLKFTWKRVANQKFKVEFTCEI